MPRKPGDSYPAMIQRQEQVWELMLRGFTTSQIARACHVSIDTAKRDVAILRDRLVDEIQARERMSLDEALAQKNMILREAWRQYSREGKAINMKLGNKIVSVIPDDRHIKIEALRTINSVTDSIHRLLGFGTPQYLERLTAIQTAQSRGFEIIKIPYTEKIMNDARLLTDEDRRRERGEIP